MRLYKHQESFLKNVPDKHLLAWETGTGKTATAINIATKKTNNSVLIVCPKSLTENWQREIEKWARDNNPGRFTVITKEQFRRDAAKLGRFECVVIDEAHYFSGIKSQMSKKMIAYIKKHIVPYVYLLTATPYLSTPWNIYTLAKILGRDWSYIGFKKHFFFERRIGGRMVPFPRPNIEKPIAEIVNKLGTTVKMNECVDVPDSTFLIEYFEKTASQKKAIKEINDFLPIVVYTKEHQILGGCIEEEEIKSEKFNRIIDLISEYKKICVVCRYTLELNFLRRKIQKMGKKAYIIDGQTKDRQKVVDEINDSDECVALINAMCSEGYNLPGINTMVFYSYDFSLKNYIQMIGRIQRINAIQKCVYISMVTKDSVDEEVYKCLQKKEDFDAEIYARKFEERRMSVLDK